MPHSIIVATRQADKPRHIPPPGILVLLTGTPPGTPPGTPLWYSSMELLSAGRPLEFGSHESRTSRQWLANDFSLLQVFGQTAKGGFGQCFWKLQ